jgi:hypothetical protein
MVFIQLNWEIYETKFKYKDVNVKIASASFHPEHWINSCYQQSIEAIENKDKTVFFFYKINTS